MLSGHIGAGGVKGAEGRTLGAHCQDHMLYACLQQVRPLSHVGSVGEAWGLLHVRVVEGEEGYMCVHRRLGTTVSSEDDNDDVDDRHAHLREQQAVDLRAAELDTDALAR